MQQSSEDDRPSEKNSARSSFLELFMHATRADGTEEEDSDTS